MQRFVMSRRRFVQHLADASAMMIPALTLGHAVRGSASNLKRRRKAAIVLWMSGGPSTIDIWDLKPGAVTGGPFRPIPTSGDVEICEHLPMLAKQMRHLAIIRSMSTRETDHVRGRYAMHTGHAPRPDIEHPSCGGGLARELMTGEPSKALRISQEPVSIRERYGITDLGRRCLMARRLVERGASYVEVESGGWDHHRDVHATLANSRLPELDRAMSALIEDLEQRGLLQDTVVLWMGEFGRTPRINNNAGRDHWARAWSIVLGGGGLKGGIAVGRTSADGSRVETDSYSSKDLMATVCKALDISAETTLANRNGRPVNLAGGRVIDQLFA